MSIPKSLHDSLTPIPKNSSILLPQSSGHTHTLSLSHSPPLPKTSCPVQQQCRVHGPQSALHGPPSDLCRKTRGFSVSRQHSSSCAQPSCCTIITTCDRYGRPPVWHSPLPSSLYVLKSLPFPPVFRLRLAGKGRGKE